jgi:plasmid stabilization system protein ParE
VSFRVRYSRGARDDLEELYGFLLDRDVEVASRALEAIRKATDMLKSFPFTCRKVDAANPFLRELVISFGSSGYVALFEIEGAQAGDAVTAVGAERCVTILAVRHQREDDYY